MVDDKTAAGNYLQQAVDGTDFDVRSNTPLRDAVNMELLEVHDPTDEDMKFLDQATVDFAVFKPTADHAAFAVQFDPPDANPSDPDAVRLNRLCTDGFTPLVRIGRNETFVYESESLVHFMARRHLTWDDVGDDLAGQLRDEFEQLSDEQKESMRSGDMYLLDPSFDPGVIFDLDNPFPPVQAISDRLLDWYDVHTTWTQQPVNDGNTSEPRFRCEIYPHHFYGAGLNTVVDVRYHLTDTATGEDLLDTDTTVAMQFMLPVVTDWDPTSEPFNVYWQRTGQTPATFVTLPGASPTYLVEWFGVQKALALVEAWCEQHLQRR